MRVYCSLRRKTQMQKEKMEESFVCPITGQKMVDPVVAMDGFTYERYAIERWFRDHNTSPMTQYNPCYPYS